MSHSQCITQFHNGPGPKGLAHMHLYGAHLYDTHSLHMCHALGSIPSTLLQQTVELRSQRFGKGSRIAFL